MIRSIPKPDISQNFTVDDIHKIREWHNEMLKYATTEERRKFYDNASKKYDELAKKL